MEKNLYKRIEEWLGENISIRANVGGGCISNTEKLALRSGRILFLKSGSKNSMFLREANSLKELAKPAVIRIPQVLLVDEEFILLENISLGSKDLDFFSVFGQQMARLHRYSNERYGFYEDNFIGATPQINIPSAPDDHNWTQFYYNKRLLYQFCLAEKKGYSTEKLRKGFHLLENRIEDILAGSEEQPSLLHGDLWSGNYICDEKGNAVLIDPAVYYGHREADLAMTRLFGGFSEEFYSAYNKEYPLKEGASYRENIYQLYHVMNHLNLFGKGYLSQAESLLWSYL